MEKPKTISELLKGSGRLVRLDQRVRERSRVLDEVRASLPSRLGHAVSAQGSTKAASPLAWSARCGHRGFATFPRPPPHFERKARHAAAGVRVRVVPLPRDLNIRFAQLPLVLLCIAVWMLVHPYEGIFHDANLYTLQALARLHPVSLVQDVFLHFGSQDRFTLFSPAYAAAIQLLGVDHAAALLTGLSQLALVAAGWCLARSIMPARYALLGVALLLAIP